MYVHVIDCFDNILRFNDFQSLYIYLMCYGGRVFFFINTLIKYVDLVLMNVGVWAYRTVYHLNVLWGICKHVTSTSIHVCTIQILNTLTWLSS